MKILSAFCLSLLFVLAASAIDQRNMLMQIPASGITNRAAAVTFANGTTATFNGTTGELVVYPAGVGGVGATNRFAVSPPLQIATTNDLITFSLDVDNLTNGWTFGTPGVLTSWNSNPSNSVLAGLILLTSNSIPSIVGLQSASQANTNNDALGAANAVSNAVTALYGTAARLNATAFVGYGDTNTFTVAGGTLTTSGRAVSITIPACDFTAYALTGTVSAAWAAASNATTIANSASGSASNANMVGSNALTIANAASQTANAALPKSGGTITGSLNVNGTIIYTTIVNITTNVYAGTITNYVNDSIYTTNILSIITVTNTVTTNTVNTYVNIGGSFTMGNGSTFIGSNAASIYFPGLTLTGGMTSASGSWDWTGATWVNPPTNGWVFGTTGALTNSGGVLTSTNGIVSLATNDWKFGTPNAITNITGGGTWSITNGTGAFTPAVLDFASLTGNISTSQLPTVGFSGGTWLGGQVVNGSMISTGRPPAEATNTVTLIVNGTTNTTELSGNPVFDLGNIAVVTGSVASASNAGSLNGVPGGAYLQTNGNGSALTGIAAAQVGAVSNTAAGISAAGGLTNNGVTYNGVGVSNGSALTGGATNFASLCSTATVFVPFNAIFGRASVGSITGSNAAAPIQVFLRTATDEQWFNGFTSSQSNSSVYAGIQANVPIRTLNIINWGTGHSNGVVDLAIYQSGTSTTTNALIFRSTAANKLTQISTTIVASAANTAQIVSLFPTNSLGSVTNYFPRGATNYWTIGVDYQQGYSATNAIGTGVGAWFDVLVPNGVLQ